MSSVLVSPPCTLCRNQSCVHVWLLFRLCVSLCFCACQVSVLVYLWAECGLQSHVRFSLWVCLYSVISLCWYVWLCSSVVHVSVFCYSLPMSSLYVWLSVCCVSCFDSLLTHACYVLLYFLSARLLSATFPRCVPSALYIVWISLWSLLCCRHSFLMYVQCSVRFLLN